MYLREVSVKRKDGRVVTYLRLVQSHRDPKKGYPVQKVIHSFGKVTEVNRKELTSIATSILNYLNASDEQVIKGDATISSSRSYGTVHLVKELSLKLGILPVIRSQLKRRQFASPVALAIQAMVTNRLMEPFSKHGMVMSDWLDEDIYLPGSEGLKLQHVYRGLDFLEECKEELEKELFWHSRNLFNTKVDMVFYDTTSTFVEGEGEDDLLQYGYSRDHRRDRKQVVVGLATDRDGLPITSSIFPGNTMDMLTMEAMLKRLKPFDIDRCLFVCDRGLVSEENLSKLKEAGYGYLVGVKLRKLKEVREEVLSKKGRFIKVQDNLKVKEVFVSGKRYLVCLNEEEKERDREIRKAIVERLEKELEAVNTGSKNPCVILKHPIKKRFIRELKTGKLVLNQARIKNEGRYDGKYVLLTSEMKQSAGELARQYKNLFRVERAFRTLKSGLDLRPLYHRVSHRIGAHVFLCVLAYYIARYAELKTGLSWRKINQISRRLQAVKIDLKNGPIIRTTKVSEKLQVIVNKLDIKTPPKILV